MSREDEIKEQVDTLLRELDIIRAQNRLEIAGRSVGKFFKADYEKTVAYRSVIELTSDGMLLCFDVYKNSFEKWEIGERTESLLDARWKEITKSEFLAVLRKAHDEIKSWFDLYELEAESKQ